MQANEVDQISTTEFKASPPIVICAAAGDRVRSPCDDAARLQTPGGSSHPDIDAGGGSLPNSGSNEGSSLSSLPSTAAGRPPLALPPPSASHAARGAPNSVSIVLTDGDSLDAEPYEHSVSGHHIMLKEKGKIWKATRENRETRFYEHVGALYASWEARSAGVLASSCAGDLRALQSTETPQGDSSSSRAVGDLTATAPAPSITEEEASAALLYKFLPRYYGTRKVLKLRCGKQASRKASLEQETAIELNRLRMEQFPAVPADGPYDASAPHTARDIVQSFMVEQRHSPSPITTPYHQSSIHSPGSGSGSGDDLGKALPRHSDERFVDMVVLEDLCDQMELPCVLDIKMGSRQYGVDASAEKRRSKNVKSMKSTSGVLGLRIAGLKFFKLDAQGGAAGFSPVAGHASPDGVRSRAFSASAGIAWRAAGSSRNVAFIAPQTGMAGVAAAAPVTRGKAECRYLGPLEVEHTLFEFCQQSEALCGKFASTVDEIRAAFARQTAFRFFTSSLLLIYDAAKAPLERSAKVVMVDFAYTYTIAELVAAGDEDLHLTRDEAFIKGLDSLGAMLSRNACHNQGDN